jgi:hypothetical protein
MHVAEIRQRPGRARIQGERLLEQRPRAFEVAAPGGIPGALAQASAASRVPAAHSCEEAPQHPVSRRRARHPVPDVVFPMHSAR